MTREVTSHLAIHVTIPLSVNTCVHTSLGI